MIAKKVKRMVSVIAIISVVLLAGGYAITEQAHAATKYVTCRTTGTSGAKTVYKNISCTTPYTFGGSGEYKNAQAKISKNVYVELLQKVTSNVWKIKWGNGEGYIQTPGVIVANDFTGLGYTKLTSKIAVIYSAGRGYVEKNVYVKYMDSAKSQIAWAPSTPDPGSADQNHFPYDNRAYIVAK